MKQYKDIQDMTNDELEEYLTDISTGYAYDPDNEILDGDKNTTFKEFFNKMNAEIKASRFKSLQEFAETLSRSTRMCEWAYGQICQLSDNLAIEFKQRIQERLDQRNNGGAY